MSLTPCKATAERHAAKIMRIQYFEHVAWLRPPQPQDNLANPPQSVNGPRPGTGWHWETVDKVHGKGDVTFYKPTARAWGLWMV
jgi:hypothetical protein